ncbi:MAG TPA: Uma2 family endonuclease [Thermoanaerobaculia bacterium]|nr:Uma2 family endonuclease [Thermoanaerobaculia bacterium]
MEQPFRIPATARDFEGFRRWARSKQFPQYGRIDYVDGDLEVDMSPEEIHTHSAVKAEIALKLLSRIVEPDLGMVHIASTRITFPEAQLSTEPDLIVVLWDSLDKGRVREVPTKRNRPERSVELEGAADLVVEVISDSSVGKDRTRLPPKYAAAGVPELWLADVRRGLRFEVHVLGPEGYRLLAPDADGWVRSPLLGLVHLRRERRRPDRWSYRLDVGED